MKAINVISLLLQSLFLILLFPISLFLLVRTLTGEFKDYPSIILTVILTAVTLVIFFSASFRRSMYFPLKGYDSKAVLENASWLKTIALLTKILIVVIFVLIAVIATFYTCWAAVGFVYMLDTEPTNLSELIAIGLYTTLYGAAFISTIFFGYLAMLFLPFWAALPMAVVIGREWKNPGRFLLLRPFNREYATDQLRIIARRRLAFLGHIYTLADKRIKVPWYVRIPIFLGQLCFLQFRMRNIQSKSQLSELSENMANRWKRNLNWCVSWNKIFSVSTVDELWKDCFVQMANICDVIFLDLSEMRESILWEIEQCSKMGISDRLIFLAHKNNFVEAKKYVQQNFRTGGTKRLSQYKDIGILVDSDFESTIADMVT